MQIQISQETKQISRTPAQRWGGRGGTDARIPAAGCWDSSLRSAAQWS